MTNKYNLTVKGVAEINIILQDLYINEEKDGYVSPMRDNNN